MLNVLSIAALLSMLRDELGIESPAAETHPDVQDRWMQLASTLEGRLPTVKPTESGAWCTLSGSP